MSNKTQLASQSSKTPKTKSHRLLKYATGALIVVSVVAIGYASYVFTSPIAKKNHLTFQQIESRTAYNESDSALVSSIKSSALATHLATGNTLKIQQLPDTLTKINNITSGKLSENGLKRTLKYLTDTYQLSKKDIANLESTYRKATLALNISKLNQLSEQSSTNWNDINLCASNIYATSKQLLADYLKSTTTAYPSEIDAAISAINALNQKIDHTFAFNDLFNNPSTTTLAAITSFGALNNFESPYEEQFKKLTQYATDRDTVLQHNADLQAFKQTVDSANSLKSRTLALTDWVGKTLGDAKRAIKASGCNYRIADGSDTDDKAVIIEQSPNTSNYALITKNSTITLRTEPKVVEAPSTTTPANPNKSQDKPADTSTQTSPNTKPASDAPKQSTSPQSSAQTAPSSNTKDDSTPSGANSTTSSSDVVSIDRN